MKNMTNANELMATNDLSEGSNRLFEENSLFFAWQEYRRPPEPQNITPAQYYFTQMHGDKCAYEKETLNCHYISYKPVIFIYL